MSFDLTVSLDQGGTLTISLPHPEYEDVTSHVRRQFTGTTDGGAKFVQDLGREDRFLDFSWVSLSQADRSDLLRILRAAEWQMKSFKIEASTSILPVGISTGQSIEGTAINTGQTPPCFGKALNTGQNVLPDTMVVGEAFLEQPDAVLEQVRNGYANVTMRFRIPGGPVVAGS